MQIGALFAVIAFAFMLQLSGTTLVERESQPSQTTAGVLLPVTAEPTVTAASVIDVERELTEPVNKLTVTTRSVQNIESSSVLARGSLTIGEASVGSVFFVYGQDRTEVDQVRNAATFERASRAGVQTVRLTRRQNSDREFERRLSNLAFNTTYYVVFCVETANGLSCGSIKSFTTTNRTTRPGEARLPTISQVNEFAITDEVVHLEARIQMNDLEEGDVYLIYGESVSLVDEARGLGYREIEPEEDRLERTRVDRNVRGSEVLGKALVDLEPETDYYYAWCVSYDGVRTGVVCTRTSELTTHSRLFGQSPIVSETNSTVAADTVIVRGDVSMQSFLDGYVFFVYGTDEHVIAHLPGERSFASIRQNGDRLQKYVVDSDLDRSDTFTHIISDLPPDTTYTVRLCVQYENENADFREVLFIACGEVTQFTTTDI